MRQLIGSVAVTVALAFALPKAARANEITLSITANDVSGMLLGDMYHYYQFSDRTVTFTASLTTAQLAACQSDPTCYSTTQPSPYGVLPYPDQYQLIQGKNYDLSITVQGIGTFRADNHQRLDINNFGPNSSGQIIFVEPGGPYFGAALSLGTDPNLLQNLVNVQAAGIFPLGGQLGFSTAGVGVYLDEPAGEQVTVNLSAPGGSTAVTPEPGAWVMVGTGLLGGVGVVRPRWGRRRLRIAA